MSIFDRIKTAIFGKRRSATAGVGTGAGTTATRRPGTYTPSSSQARPGATAGVTTGAAATAATRPAEPVDIESVMQEFESEKGGQKLNWRTSIVDLLKLLDIDSGLENRKELARELGYTGSTTDTATMNIWLHKQVLRKLQENGGKVPASLLD